MANPTLISNVTPYKGFTLLEIAERLLATRGMTLDSTTMRTVAIASDQTDAYNRIRRAFDLCARRFPGVFFIQKYSTTWVQNDTLLSLPANCQAPLYVNYDGKTLRRMTRVQRQNILDGIQSGSQTFKMAGDPMYYHIAGIANEASANPPDYRLVIELLPHPADAKTIEIGYNARAPQLVSATAGDTDDYLPVDQILQEWILRRAMMLWGADSGDTLTIDVASAELKVLELDMDEISEANLDAPTAIYPEYPTMPEFQRRR